jgi:ABC-type branched-subunit amino acid transport system substrate-binding protein
MSSEIRDKSKSSNLLLTAVCLSIGATACVTTPRRATDSRRTVASAQESAIERPYGLPPGVAGPASIPGGELSADQKWPAPLAAPPAASGVQAEITRCREIVQRFSPPYKELYDSLKTQNLVGLKLASEKLAFATTPTCDVAATRQELVQSALTTINTHSGRIGLILPLTGPNAKFSNYVISGMRAAFREAGKSFEQNVILKDSGSTPSGMTRGLAELIVRDQVGVVIGGFNHSEAEILAKWSDKLFLPVVLLNRDRDLTKASRYAFMVYPDELRLADALVQGMAERRLKRVAILKPTSGKADKVIEYFKQSIVAAGGEVVTELPYTPGSFETMQDAAFKLFKMSMTGREEEFKAAYKKAQEDAEANGEAFNAKMVYLKPIIDFDAVFIPDDFRTIRYFIKIFRYNRVERVTMIGNHEWRSPALIEPYDDFLSGSIFADFIGSYAKIPQSIPAPLLSSQYFVDPQSVASIDFQLVGFRSAQVARAAINQQAGRRQIATAMAKVTTEQVGFPGNVRLFDDTRHAAWPTYLFTIKKQGLFLESSNPRGLSFGGPVPGARRG